MNWDIVEGKWKQFAGNLKDTWGKFTDSDITQLSGKRDHLVGLVQERYGVLKDDAERQVDAWTKTLHVQEGKLMAKASDMIEDGKHTRAKASEDVKARANDTKVDVKASADKVKDAAADIANKSAEALANASKKAAVYVNQKTSK